MSEINACDRWIYGALAADTALVAVVSTRLYVDLAPQTPTIVTPYVIWQMQSAVDLMVVGGIRVWTNALFLVRGVDKSLTWEGNSKTMADRIDAALHRASGTNVNGAVYACVREQAWRMMETADDGIYRSAGGIYRLYAA